MAEEEKLRREVVRAEVRKFMDAVLEEYNEREFEGFVGLVERARADALRDHYQARTFEGDEAEVREWLASNTRSGVLYRLAEQALALLDAKDTAYAALERAALAQAETTERVMRERDDANRRAEQAEAKVRALAPFQDMYDEALVARERAEQALAERDAAIVEAHRRCTELDYRGARYWLSEVAEVLKPFLPAKPDPLVAMLCGELDISPAAAEKALAHLEAKGLIERAGGTISFEGRGDA